MTPAMKKEIFRLLCSKKIDDLLVYIEALSNSVEDEKEREKLITLHTYFTTNKDGLIGWHGRGLKLPKPPEGKEYRRIGHHGKQHFHHHRKSYEGRPHLLERERRQQSCPDFVPKTHRQVAQHAEPTHKLFFTEKNTPRKLQ